MKHNNHEAMLAILNQVDEIQDVKEEEIHESAKKYLKKQAPPRTTTAKTMVYWPDDELRLRFEKYLYERKVEGSKISGSALIIELIQEFLDKKGI